MPKLKLTKAYQQTHHLGPVLGQADFPGKYKRCPKCSTVNKMPAPLDRCLGCNAPIKLERSHGHYGQLEGEIQGWNMTTETVAVIHKPHGKIVLKDVAKNKAQFRRDMKRASKDGRRFDSRPCGDYMDKEDRGNGGRLFYQAT